MAFLSLKRLRRHLGHHDSLIDVGDWWIRFRRCSIAQLGMALPFSLSFWVSLALKGWQINLWRLLVKVAGPPETLAGRTVTLKMLVMVVIWVVLLLRGRGRDWNSSDRCSQYGCGRCQSWHKRTTATRGSHPIMLQKPDLVLLHGWKLLPWGAMLPLGLWCI